MSKEKQINEMTKIIDDNHGFIVSSLETAKALYNAGYRKQNKDAVEVISRREVDFLRASKNLHEAEFNEIKAELELRNAEIERLKATAELAEVETERLKQINNSYALQYGTVKDQQKVIDEAKSEDVKEIFEEVEKILAKNIAWGSTGPVIYYKTNEVDDALVELKKKYNIL